MTSNPFETYRYTQLPDGTVGRQWLKSWLTRTEAEASCAADYTVHMSTMFAPSTHPNKNES